MPALRFHCYGRDRFLPPYRLGKAAKYNIAMVALGDKRSADATALALLRCISVDDTAPLMRNTDR